MGEGINTPPKKNWGDEVLGVAGFIVGAYAGLIVVATAELD